MVVYHFWDLLLHEAILSIFGSYPQAICNDVTLYEDTHLEDSHVFVVVVVVVVAAVVVAVAVTVVVVVIVIVIVGYCCCCRRRRRSYCPSLQVPLCQMCFSLIVKPIIGEAWK